MTDLPNLSTEDIAVIVDRFPQPQTLSFSVLSNVMTMDAAILLTTMDQLCILSIDRCYFIDDRVMHILLRSLGGRLKFLHLIGTKDPSFDTLKEIHTHCPNLETLHINVVAQVSKEEIWYFVASYSRLRRLVIIQVGNVDDCFTFMGMNAKNEEYKISVGMF